MVKSLKDWTIRSDISQVERRSETTKPLDGIVQAQFCCDKIKKERGE